MNLESLTRELRGEIERLRAPEGYLRAGAPRYHTLFGRDSLIAAWQLLSLDPRIARDTLRTLARYQGREVRPRAEEEPGKILHEHRFDTAARAELPDWDFPYYGSVDSTLLFLVVAGQYVRATRDRQTLRELWPSIRAAYAWMREYGDRDCDGYVEYERANPRGLFHQGWKDGSEDHLRVEPPVTLVEVQGYAVAAHRAVAALGELRGDSALAIEAHRAAEALIEQIRADFWTPGEGFVTLALDGRGRPRRAVTSNPGHLLAMGAVRPEDRRTLVDRLFEDDMWTRFGLRTHSEREPDFDPFSYHLGSVWPHDNWFFWKGLVGCGFSAEAARVREAILQARQHLGKIPELYAVVEDDIVDLSIEPSRGARANPLQAWASAGLLSMIRDIH